MLAVNMGLVGKGITTLSYIPIEREIELSEERLYTIENNLLILEETELNENTPSNLDKNCEHKKAHEEL